MSTCGEKRCPLVLAAELQHPKDQPDAVSGLPLLGDMEAGYVPDDYEGSNSGVDERGNTPEDDDNDLEEQAAGQHADIGNYLPEYAGLQLGEDSENGDEDNKGDVDMTAMMGPQGHRLREIATPQCGIPSQKQGEPLLEANGKKEKATPLV